MNNGFSRTQMLLGKDAMETLYHSSIAVFGVGGVGSYAVEALARCGIGEIAIFDDDKVCVTNINRQLIATRKTVGQKKVEVMKGRIHEINSECAVEANECFYSAENADAFDLGKYDYIVDAIDTVSSKLILIECAKAAERPIISCMGAGNKLDPTRFEVADIYETSMCPLAKVMRKELRARGIDALKVVYSKEKALSPDLPEGDINCNSCDYQCEDLTGDRRGKAVRRQIPGSISFVPSVAGLIIASEIVKDIIASK